MLDEHWGYIYGTAGTAWTAQKQEALASKYGEGDKNYGMSVKFGKKWIGHMVTDCSGVMVYIWRKFGLSIPHGSSSMVRQGYIVDCGSTPHPGWAALADPTPDTPDNNHIGIVGADGYTIYEARGTTSGFVTSNTANAKWTKYGRFKDVDYSKEVPTMDTPYTARVNTDTGALNIRTGPGMGYGILGTAKKGEIVKVITHGSDWDFAECQIGSGYVATRYLTPIEEIKPDPADDYLVDATLVSADGSRITLNGKWKLI